MPRPRTVSDDAILDGVVALIGRVGPAQVTLARVAAEVGLSPATLVQRFGSKRGLLLTLARRDADRWGRVFAAADDAAGPLERLVAGLCAAAAPVRSPESMAHHLAFLQTDLVDPEFRAAADDGMGAMRSQVAALLREAVETGALAPVGDMARLARAVQTTYNGALIGWAIERHGTLEAWLRSELEFALAPYRAGVAASG